MTKFLVRHFIKDYQNTQQMSVRTSYGLLGSIVGIFCNILLFILKFAVGSWIRSLSVVADAFNNLSDAGAAILTFVGVKMASKPADEEHPFGHGRMEYIVAFIVAFLVIEVGFSFFKDAIGTIREPRNLQFHFVSVILLLLSVAVKLWLCVFNRKLGRTINSKVMLATATDSLGDVIATSATILSVVVFQIWGINMDAFVGIGVSLVIMWAGIGIAKDTLEPLLGTAVPKETYEQIITFVESFDGILGTHDLIVHNYGPGRSMASVHAEVANDVDVEVSHEIIDSIEREAQRQLGLFLVIHMDPIGVNNEQLQKAKQEAMAIIKEMDTALSIHDFRIVDGENQINLIFDLVVPASYTKEKRKEICRTLREHMYEADSRYQCVIQVESSFVAEER